MIKLISDREKMMIVEKIYEHSEGVGPEKARANTEFLLEKWQEAKSVRLQKLFGDNLILSKEIVVTKSRDEMKRELRRVNFELTNRILDIAYAERDRETLSWDAMRFLNDLGSVNNIIDNRVHTSITIEYKGETYKFTEGQKLTKALRTVIKMFPDKGLTEEMLEDFRIKQSQHLNDKTVKGKFCLSIHPLDYITLSDNNNGWESCMSWDDKGCHRAGTLELMNCENTLVAYVESDTYRYNIAGEDWNSKKYRQLIMLTPDLAMTNKSYPFRNDDMSKLGLQWVMELAEKNLGMEFFPDMWSYDDGAADIPGVDRIIVETDLMYDDTDNRSHSFVALTIDHESVIEFNLGGQAYCLTCLSTIDDADSLNCYDCRREVWCECCQEYFHEDEVTWLDDGAVCHSCLDSYYSCCERCGDYYDRERSMVYVDEEDAKETGVSEGAYCYYCHEKLLENAKKEEGINE